MKSVDRFFFINKHTVRLVCFNPTRFYPLREILFLFLLANLLSGCDQNSASGEDPATENARVSVSPVRPGPEYEELSFSGTIEAEQTIPLSFRTAGIVHEVMVEAGDRVRRGQLLATLDDADLRNIHTTALAKFNQAQDACNRLKQVYDQGSLPEIRWVEMKTNLEQASASLELAKNNLAKCSLVSPIDGWVGRRNIEPGMSSVTLTGAPVELVRIEKVLVRIPVPETEINKIKKRDKASVVVPAADGLGVEGTVSHLSPVAELLSRTYTVKITVDNPDAKLKPGMVCDVTLRPESETIALVVPYQAVKMDVKGQTYVFAVDTERSVALKKAVTTGRYLDGGIVIHDGLSEGELVVISGSEKLSDNTKIAW